MLQLSDEQLNNLNKDALKILVASLQSQLLSIGEQLSANNHQIELLTEQIRIMNQRQFGKRTEQSSSIEGQMSVFNIFNE